MDCVIFIGVPGSGKSAFFKARFADTHVRINRDMLKTKGRETRFFSLCLETGQRCVVDNTNATTAERARFIAEAKQHGFRVSGYWFNIPTRTAVARNAARPETARIPVVGIFATAKRLQPPTLAEGFDELYRIDESGSVTVLADQPVAPREAPPP